MKSTTEGRSFLSAYKDLLDNTGRRKLCNLIVRRELQDNPEISVKTLLASSCPRNYRYFSKGTHKHIFYSLHKLW